MSNRLIRIAFALALCLSLTLGLACCAGSTAPDPQNQSTTSKALSRVWDSVTITMQSDSSEQKAADGTVVYRGSASYPQVKIKGNAAAGNKISAFFLSEIQYIIKPTDDFAAEYEEYISQGLDYFSSNEFSLNTRTLRADERIIAFEVELCRYYAGAIHEEIMKNGVCFSTQTGEVLSFSDLAPDEAAFKGFLIERLCDEVSSSYDSNALFSDCLDSIAEQVGSNELCWGLTEDALHIYFNPYIIAPYAQGIIEIDLPFTDLKEYLNEAVI